MNILWVSPFLLKSDASHAGGRARAHWIQWTAPAGVRAARRHAGHGAHRRLLRAPGHAATRLLAAGGFDLVHVEYLETGLGLDGALLVPKLAVAIGELARPARHRLRLARAPRSRLGAWLYVRAIGRPQRRICRKFGRILALSEHDRRTLLVTDLALSVGVLPFPIGIDPARAAGAARDEASLLFVGAMHRDANVDAVNRFCRTILPRIRTEVPTATFTIAGGDPHPRSAGSPTSRASA